jgi:excisionase family DNA binding protein
VEDQLTTRQVADALHVSESSVKRWCDRGAIPTIRTLGGHRRIPLDGFLRFLEETNRQVLVPSKLKQSDEASARVGSESVEIEIEDLLPQFEQAVIAGDEAACRVLLTKYYARHESFAKLADEFIAATFHRLGELWDCGSLEIYQERRGCEVCHRLLYEFRRLVPEAPPNAPVAIGASPSGDPYTLPNQIIELVLRECSWRATNLGTNLPFETIAQAVHAYQPKLLWLSVSYLDDEVAFVDDYSKFRSQLPEPTLVILGGRALHDRLRPKLKYTAHCDNMQQLAAFAAALHGQPQKIGASNN